MLLQRAIYNEFCETLKYRRVVLVAGPRQAGKTTLVQQLVKDLGHGSYTSMDNTQYLKAALEDPIGFVELAQRPLVIDEIQRAGNELVLAIKLAVDQSQDKGQFVLTGSSNFLTVPNISESLAGRLQIVHIWPLTQSEIAQAPTTNFVDDVFRGTGSTRPHAQAAPKTKPDQYMQITCRGGYPEVLPLPPRRRSQWFNSYVETILQRDIADISGIRKVKETRHILELIAARSANELVMQNLVKDSSLSRNTVIDRVAWLERVYLTMTIPAWATNLTKRATRAPKIYITDSGLAASLLNMDPASLLEPTNSTSGILIETFAANEIMRHLTWATTQARLFHFRDSNGPEIDLLIERTDGKIIAIEIKKTLSVSRQDFRWLKLFRDRLGDRFIQGLVLYLGDDTLPFGDRLTALPMSILWTAQPSVD